MIRNRLEQLSRDALERVADKNDIEVSAAMDHEALVDAIMEAVEESRRDREAQNNNPVKIGETKFLLFEEEMIEEDDLLPDDYSLPTSYNDTRVVLMLRDPGWAFVYWDLAPDVRKSLERSSSFEYLLLRVCEGEKDCDKSRSQTFDIPVDLEDSRWYINLPRQATRYRIELRSIDATMDTRLAVSNSVHVPLGTVPDLEEGEPISTADRILAYSGLNRLDVAAFRNRVPQRILTLVEDDRL
jgi:hypothetical protein